MDIWTGAPYLFCIVCGIVLCNVTNQRKYIFGIPAPMTPELRTCLDVIEHGLPQEPEQQKLDSSPIDRGLENFGMSKPGQRTL